MLIIHIFRFIFSAPSPAGSYTPSPGTYGQSPSPAGFGNTPSPMGYSPMTPGSAYTPQTPGMGEFWSLFVSVLYYHLFLTLWIHVGLDTGSDWLTTDILVRIKDTHDDQSLILQMGVLRSVSVSPLSYHNWKCHPLLNPHKHFQVLMWLHVLVI